MFSPFPLVTDLHRAHRQYDGDDEEQQSAHHSRRDRLVLDPGRHREFDLFAVLEVFQRVGHHPEIVRTAAHQTFHCEQE